MQFLLLVFLATAAVSYSLTPVVIAVYRRLGWVAGTKRKRLMDTHERSVPRGGGVPILVSVLLGLWWFVPRQIGVGLLGLDQHLVGVMLGALMVVVIGVVDDAWDLNPYLRLGWLFIAASIVAAAGIGIPYINLPFVGVVGLDQPRIVFELLGKHREIWVLADLFALFWIVGVMNFVNWSKGVDGQLPGVVMVAALTVGILSFRFSADITQWPVIILAVVTAGAYGGFLPWNFYPQRIMPGFGGGALGGYLLAVMAILATAKVGTLLVVLGVPFLDAGLTLLRRVAKGRSPVWGDRGHLHHHLLDDLGWSKRKIAIFYWLVTAALGGVALRLNSQQKFYTMLSLGLILGGGLLWLRYFGQSSRRRGHNAG